MSDNRTPCLRPWTGSATGDARCGVCSLPWHEHERVGHALELNGCGQPDHWTAGGQATVGYCGACMAVAQEKAHKDLLRPFSIVREIPPRRLTEFEASETDCWGRGRDGDDE